MTSATMQSPGDTNWFKVTLTAGKTYDFKLTGLSADALIEIVPVAGAADASTLVGSTYVTYSGLANFSPATSGAYYVKVVDPSGAAGAYSLTGSVVANSEPVTAPKAIGMGANSETMQSAGDADWFSISLTKGDTYNFKQSGLSTGTQINIVAASATGSGSTALSSLSEPVGVSTTNFTAGATGAYRVEVVDPFGRIGAYTLSAALVANGYAYTSPAALTVGATKAATMQSAGDSDWFKVSLTAGDTYTIAASGLDIEAAVYIFPAAKAPYYPDEYISNTAPKGVATSNLTAGATGVYDVEVVDYSGLTGAYNLSATKVSNSDTLAAPVTLTVGATKAATMQSAGDTDWFKVTLVAGDTYLFTESGLDANARLTIVPASSASQAFVRLTGTPGPASAVSANFTADSAGVYYVEASDGSGMTGAYKLAASVVKNSDTLALAATLAVGKTYSETMQSAGDADWFKISLVAGDTYSFKETGLGALADVAVVALAKASDVSRQITPVTFPAAGATANFTADASGVYAIEVEDPYNVTGSYKLTTALVGDSYTLSHPGALTV